ncbi:unnamed protein product, partial [Didymodactylos carnosus]
AKVGDNNEIFHFSRILMFPSNLLTIESNFKSLFDVAFDGIVDRNDGKYMLDQIYIGNDCTMGNSCTIEIRSNIPSNTIVGTMTRFDSKTIITTENKYERVILGIPARQMPFEFKPALLDTTTAVNNQQETKLIENKLILPKYIRHCSQMMSSNYRTLR